MNNLILNDILFSEAGLGGFYMTSALYILVASEIIFINLITLDRCAKRKYSGVRTMVSMLIFSVAAILLGIAVLSRLPIYGNGNGLFVWFGFLYLIPAKMLYQDSMERLFVIFCSAWVYTLSAFAAASQIGKALPSQYFNIAVTLIQTGIFIFITPVFFRKILKIYLEILHNIQPNNTKYLKCTSLLWFSTIFMVNFAITLNAPIFKIAAVIILFLNACSSYLLLRTVIDQTLSVDSLKAKVNLDALTGVPNRVELINDAERLLKAGKSFCLIFMDLDGFKAINDSYGHMAGDEYLCSFAALAKQCIGKTGRLYRIGGDEFVGIIMAIDASDIIERLENIKFELDGIRFKGVSIGYARSSDYKNLDMLTEAADKNMYKNKYTKKTETWESNKL